MIAAFKISTVASNDSILFPCRTPAKSAIRCFRRVATFGPSLYNISVTQGAVMLPFTPSLLLALQLELTLPVPMLLLLDVQLCSPGFSTSSTHCRCGGGSGLALMHFSSCRLALLLLKLFPLLLTSLKQHTSSSPLAAATKATAAASPGTDCVTSPYLWHMVVE